MSEHSLQERLLLHLQTYGHPLYMRRLLASFRPDELAGLNVAEIEGLGIPGPIAARIGGPVTSVDRRYVERALQWRDVPGHRIVQLGDDDYPERLAEIADPPCLLFVRGDVSLLGSTQLAIVGSRKQTAGGRRIAMSLAAELCRAGLVITSGLAIGIDAAAHRGALEAGGTTIAVLGSGCDVIHPRSNRDLARDVLENGVIISEFPLGTAASPQNFPQRNRIVTGMAVGTLVVEAALGSGSLISARLAAEQGREVFAVPGSIHNVQSRGCHQLIRQGAKLTECAADILEELEGFVPEVAQAVSSRLANLSPVQRKVVEALGADPISVDEIKAHSGLDIAEILSALIELEIDGIVRSELVGYTLAPHPAEKS